MKKRMNVRVLKKEISSLGSYIKMVEKRLMIIEIYVQMLSKNFSLLSRRQEE